MTEVQSAPMDPASNARNIPERTGGPPLSSISISSDSTKNRFRTGQLTLDTFSPVNQNGSFEFDRVLKCGYVQKRTRKTKVELYYYSDTVRLLLMDYLGLEAYLSRPTATLSLNIQRPK